MSTIYDRLITDARSHLPGAVDTEILSEAINAIDEFCKDSNVWQEDIPIVTDENYTTYYVSPTSGDSVRLMHVLNAAGRGVPASMEVPGEVVLRDAPPDAETWTVRIAVSPNRASASPTVPTWLLDRYHLVLVDGVLGRMMSQPAKPYSNERVGIYHMRRFRNGMAGARVDSMHENLYRGQRWRFPQAFATSRR